jgi:nitroimidazol reductase NimA-like FMN-containing flavoprotein (pyridoxamine 5'-phosphate oxidase superfamily)
MVEYTGTWDRDGVAAFLAEVTVPVRLACRTPGGGLWMLSLWYGFDAESETFACATSADADVVRYLEADDGVAFEVSTNDPPYRGVRGAGTATVSPDPEKAVLRELLERYLGGTDSSLARRLLAPERDEVTIRVDPERCHSWDFSDRMKDV